MRRELAKLKGGRYAFQGVFVRFGTRSGYQHPLNTVLLRDIRMVDTEKIIADHIWLTEGKRLARLDLKEGETIRFEARVTPYVKGYRGYQYHDYSDEYRPMQRDYRLSFPSKVARISDAAALPRDQRKLLV